MTMEILNFKAETKQILDLVIHSLYSHKEIFLRELISNASDAIDKAHFLSLTDDHILENEKEWKIKILVNKDSHLLTISDNGIGMTREETVTGLGTIAHSGTKEFLSTIQSKEVKDNPNLIGQFGVGFYSAYMVADKVTVITRKAGSGNKNGIKWESTADGSFTIEDIQKEGKGTDVILHLKADEDKYLEEWEIRDIVKKYSDFIEHSIVMDVEREQESSIDKTKKVKVIEEETLNSRKAIWLRNKTEISDTEYNEFFKHITHDFNDPAKTIHYKAEGTSEFTALLYIPSKRPFDIFYKEYKTGLALYVKRVKIMDHYEDLIPAYLRFVKGVVDSSDLPLNVSRELLQKNQQIEKIKKNVTKKILDTLKELNERDYEKYLKFYQEFGKVLKEGIHFDLSHREAIAELLLFPSTKTEQGKLKNIPDYVKEMKEGQEEIYYITGTSVGETLKSPYLEAFKEKGFEVFLMLDEVDDIILNRFEYKGKKFKSLIKGDISLDKTEKAEKEKAEKKYAKLIDLIKARLKNDLKDVRFSSRLKDSVCCLVGDEGAIDPQMEKLLKSMGQNVPESKRILEINSTHPLFEEMNKLFEKDSGNKVLEEYIDMLYEQALLLEGSKPKDISNFTKVVTKLMKENLSHDIK